MDYRQLGSSGLRVSALTLGTMTFGGRDQFANVGTTDVTGATRQIDLCLDRGINFIDTANVYSRGLSEEILGEVMSSHPPRRDRVVLATKARMPMGAGPNDAGLSRHHLIAECEASLRRMQVDHIDLYQVHEWDGETPLEETMEALDSLVQSGKVRYVGASNYAGWQLMKALATADGHGYERFVTQQIYYSLQARDAEYELVPIAVDQGIGILVWSPLAGGLLSGKYRRGVDGPAGSRQLTEWNEPPVPRGQPRRRRARAVGRRARPARGAQPAAAAVPVLAPGEDGRRPAVARRPGAAGTASGRVASARCHNRAVASRAPARSRGASCAAVRPGCS